MTDVIQSEIVEEVRNARRKILESFGGDFERYCRDVMKRQGSSGHRVVSGPSYDPEAKHKVAETQAKYGTTRDHRPET